MAEPRTPIHLASFHINPPTLVATSVRVRGEFSYVTDETTNLTRYSPDTNVRRATPPWVRVQRDDLLPDLRPNSSDCSVVRLCPGVFGFRDFSSPTADSFRVQLPFSRSLFACTLRFNSQSGAVSCLLRLDSRPSLRCSWCSRCQSWLFRLDRLSRELLRTVV